MFKINKLSHFYINVNASQYKNKLFFDFYQDFMIEVYVIGKLLKIYYLFT
jgi:hypothetical protein